MVQVLRTKLAVFDAEEITLTREEAALCLGLAEGVAEILEQDDQGPAGAGALPCPPLADVESQLAQ